VISTVTAATQLLFGLFSRTTTVRKQHEVIAEIEWHSWSSSKLRFNGTEVKTQNFIPARGYLRRGRYLRVPDRLSDFRILDRNYVFTGADGRSYRWDLHRSVVVVSAPQFFRCHDFLLTFRF
jgi:hypothetical protein